MSSGKADMDAYLMWTNLTINADSALPTCQPQ